MPLAIEVQLLTGTYEAGLGGQRAEWPPHPARLFCALVAQVRSDLETGALEWLERQGAPDVIAPEATASTLQAWVPTNAIAKRGGAALPARTNGMRTWPRALPKRHSYHVVWTDATPPPEVLEGLRALASRVSYVGRPAGMVLVRVSTNEPSAGEELRRFVPSADGPHLLRVPYPGYVDALGSAFEAGEAAEAVSRSHPFGQPGEEPPVASASVPGPYARLFTLGFPAGAGVAGWHAARVGVALRDAFLARLGAPGDTDPWPAFEPGDLTPIHGHGERIPPEERCAFLGLPFVGHPNATGDVIGAGIAIGRSLAPELRRALLQLLGLDRDEGPRIDAVRIPGPGVTLPLAPPDGRWSIEPGRWTRASKRWASVTPVVLDRWPKRWADVPEILRDGVVFAGYPEPVEIEVRRGSGVHGAPVFRPGDRKRRSGEPNRPWVHVVVTFSAPVEGPVLLGNMRFVGLGLCAPVDGNG